MKPDHSPSSRDVAVSMSMLQAAKIVSSDVVLLAVSFCYIVCVLRRINTVSQIIPETVADRKRASCDHLGGYSLSSHGVLRIRRRNARLRCQSHDISDLLTDIEMSAFTDNRPRKPSHRSRRGGCA